MANTPAQPGKLPRCYDISRTITPTLAVWPGDAPFSFTHTLRKRDGSSVNLTTITLSPHTGSHADAYYHFDDDGQHPDQMPLAHYIGPAHVVTITRQHGGIVPSDFDAYDLANLERLLIHTWVSDVPDDDWPDDFPYPTVALIDWLAAQGGVLLGLDSPSVDWFDSTDLPCHHRLRHHGIANLEYLALAGVPDGRYELVALPLKIAGVCGSPVRAVLREIEGS
ncbi:MAG: cyclase family protein [Anaerolineae bacterium]|nr:cyclase family protein [Anaerolineae bacterium]